MHELPLAPHTAAVFPRLHVLPVQQPGHVPLQELSMHFPLEQRLDALQLAHVAPLFPHAMFVDAWHLPAASQQPAQLFAPHGVLHTPALQVAPVPLQASHFPPPVPHAATALPVWHMSLLSQQPVGQLVALHVAAAWHFLSWQVCGATQAAQLAPPTPHAALAVPP